MNHAETRLLAIADDLLAATGQLRRTAEKTGEAWPNSEAKDLINRLLDIRNLISPPKSPTKQTTSL